jgi:hypothetical protein
MIGTSTAKNSIEETTAKKGRTRGHKKRSIAGNTPNIKTAGITRFPKRFPEKTSNQT